MLNLMQILYQCLAISKLLSKGIIQNYLLRLALFTEHNSLEIYPSYYLYQ